MASFHDFGKNLVEILFVQMDQMRICYCEIELTGRLGDIAHADDGADVGNTRTQATLSAIRRDTAHTHIRCCVVGLSDITDNAIGRSQENEVIEVNVVENAVEVDASEYLWSDDIWHLLKRHVADSNVPEHHGAVKDADDGWEGFDDRLMYRSESLLVGHVATRLISLAKG